MLHHDYRALWIVAGMSSATLWAMLMARAWIALELTDGGFFVGAMTFAGMIPWLIAPIGGALADRYDRAKLIAAAAVQGKAEGDGATVVIAGWEQHGIGNRAGDDIAGEFIQLNAGLSPGISSTMVMNYDRRAGLLEQLRQQTEDGLAALAIYAPEDAAASHRCLAAGGTRGRCVITF